MHANDGAGDRWRGSYYELAIEVSTAPDDERLQASAERLWSSAALVAGPWADKSPSSRVAMPALPSPEEMAATYGVLRLGNLGDVPCVSWVIREVERRSDWLDLSIPTAALEPFGLAYPLVSESPCALMATIDRALVDVAVHIFADVPFELAAIGEEVSGMWSSADLTPAAVSQGGFLLPERLARRLRPPARSQAVAPGLWWVPNRREERMEKIGER